MLLLQITILLIGFVILIKGADYLVDGSAALARRMGVRDIVIGLTIVAFGTSSPELVVNLFSALSGNTDLAVGNIVGSNIANILLILGVSAAIYPVAVKKGTVWKEIPLTLLAAVAVWILINDISIDHGTASAITRTDGLVLLLFFSIFLFYTFGISKVSGGEADTTQKRSLPVSALMIGGGLAGLILGGKFIVDNAVAIASGLGLSQSLIGLTVVAVGTSLPELATSIVAAMKKKSDIAVGNIVGSNIFNIFFVLALTSTIRPLPIAPHLNIDMAVMVLASLLLFLAMFVGKKHKLERWQGWGFLTLFIIYTVYLVQRG